MDQTCLWLCFADLSHSSSSTSLRGCAQQYPDQNKVWTKSKPLQYQPYSINSKNFLISSPRINLISIHFNQTMKGSLLSFSNEALEWDSKFYSNMLDHHQKKTCPPSCPFLHVSHVLQSWIGGFHGYAALFIAKDFLLTSQEQACTRITQLFVRLFIWLSPGRKRINT